MKISANTVKLKGSEIVRVPIDLTNALHIEIEIGNCAFRLSQRMARGQQGSNLSVSVEHGKIIVEPIASNTVVIINV